MSKEKLIPELRFPEFQNEGAWSQKRLAQFDNLVSGDGNWILSKDITSNGDFKIVQLSSIGFGTFKEKVLKTISYETFVELNGTLIQKGDLLINRMVDSNRINCCIFPYEGKYVTSVDVCWIRSNSFFDNFFLMSLLCEGSSQVKLLSLSSGAGRVRISKKNLFEKFDFLLPQNQQEQQKIASCLSSLDEVIAAHSQKLDLLKDYKKGLMQNLFPQEGEKVPKWRFKEFVGDGEWVEKHLEKIAKKIQDGTHFSPKSFDNGDFLYITSKNVKDGYIELSTAQYISKEDHENIYKRCDVKQGDVLLTKDGTIGQVCVNELTVPFSLLSSVAFIRLKPDFSNYFLYHLLVSQVGQKEIDSQIAGQALKRITLTKINNFCFTFPTLSEQQKIASCLSALDALITAQAEKIEQLKLHKKGLMQGLFPKMSEL